MNKKTYDNIYLEKLQVLFERTKQRSYELLNPKIDETIGDIGCGIGQDVFNIAKSGAKVIGIDHDQTFIEIATQRFRDNLEIDFILSEAFNIPLNKNSLNKIRFDKVLQHIENHSEVISEASRLLISGGQIQIIDSDYLSWSMFLEDEKFERKIFDIISYDRFKGANLIRQLPSLLQKNDFEITNYEVHNYIITDYQLANNITRFNKIIKEEVGKCNISKTELLVWERHTKKNFNLSVNIVVIMATKI